MEQISFDQIQQRVKQHSHHKLLLRANVGPNASRFHFEVARTVLQSAGVGMEEARQVLEALLLLQQGLSLHDRVDDEAGLSRQLHVLAGDYCSSQYYRLLAHLPNQELLVQLCQAVTAVNEAKVELYADNEILPERVLNLLETIEGELLFALSRHYLRDQATWMPQIRSLVRAHVVKSEVLQEKTSRFISIRQAGDWLSDTMDRVMHVQANSLLQPIASFAMEYLSPVQKYIEKMSFAEGNR